MFVDKARMFPALPEMKLLSMMILGSVNFIGYCCSMSLSTASKDVVYPWMSDNIAIRIMNPLYIL